MRCAIIGVGGVARENYLPALAAEPDIELALLSRRPGGADGAARQHAATVLSGYGELAAWHPDVVFITVTEEQHHVVLEEVIRRRVPRVYVEKPLVARNGQTRVDEEDLDIARRLLADAAASGVEVAVGFNYRSFETVHDVAQAATDRDWGALLGFTARAHYACWSHTIDLVHRFAGRIVRLSALEGERAHPGSAFSAPDRAVAVVTAGGATGTLRVTSWIDWSDALLELELQFERGRAVIRDLDAEAELISADGDRELRSYLGAGDRWDRYRRTFAVSIADYLARVRDGRAPAVDGADGLHELLAEAAIARSLAVGAAVDTATL